MLSNDIQTAADALIRAVLTAEKGLPEGLEVLPGYPFDRSVEELAADMAAWAQTMRNSGL